MATYRCEVITQWFYDAERNTNEQAVSLDYPAVWCDVTGQPDENLLPDPNVFVSYGNGLSEAQMTALEVDTNYVVLWSEEESSVQLLPTRQFERAATKPADGKNSAAKHGKLVSDLARLGVSGQLVAELASSKSRRENADALKVKLRTLPKAKEKEKA